MVSELRTDATLPRLLLVDDDEAILDTLSAALESIAEVETCTSAEAALSYSKRKNYDIVVADYGLPGMNGEAFLRTVAERDPHVGTLLITGSQDYFAITKQSGYRVLLKPVDPSKLSAMVQQLTSIVRMKRTVYKIRDSFA